jgi:hypothetical protein
MGEAGKVRRVVTGNDREGRSVFVSDEPIPVGQSLWRHGAEAPAPFLASTAPHIEPPLGGSSFIQIKIPSWAELKPRFEAGEIPGHDPGGFHRTETVDYIFLLSGEIELLLDEGSVMLSAGDVVVQRNALHAWRNHKDEPAEFVATMVRITPPGTTRA